MSTEKHATETHHSSTNGSGAAGVARTRGQTLARGAKAFLTDFPANLNEQIKHRPYQALGVAGAVGVGVGILLGSRILRAVLTSAASVAIVELGRAYLLGEVEQGLGVRSGKSTRTASS